MAAYTAVICDARSIGASAGSVLDAAAGSLPRLNPQLASARLRGILNPHIVSDAVGGLISADFTVPAEEAVRWRPLLRYGAAVWLFDGATPIFYGYAEQPVWTATGDCQMNVSGPWVLLGRARMREAWDLWDLSLYSKGTGANENKAGQATVNSDSTLTFSFPNGTTLQNSDRCSVDYLLFGEVAGIADGKLLTAFEFDISDATGLAANRRLRVIGKATAGAAAGDLLYDTNVAGASGRQGALNLHGTNQSGVWTSSTGYRCLRFEYIYTQVGAVTLSQDQYVTLDRVRVSTRENLFQAVSGGVVQTLDTAALARDVLATQIATDIGTSVNYDLLPIDVPPEFFASAKNQSSPDSNTWSYVWGRDPTTGTGTAPDSGVGITGFTALEWQSPADIIAALAAIDGSHVGFYLPYNGRGGYDPPGSDGAARGAGATDVGSFWLTAPPQLYYQPFPDPTQNPDYTIQTQEGAVVEPATDSQPLISYLYTNYQTVKGRQQSIVAQDANVSNYAFAQGFMRAEDYTIQPSVGDNQTPTSQAAQYLKQRRLPVTTATVTIQNDGSERYPILKQGCPVPRLAAIRPGSIQINGVAVSGLNLSAGYATHVEWWGESDTGSETVQLTLTQPPGQMHRQRSIGHLVNRIHRVRSGPFAGF
jgi:hypothetical protein